MQAVKFTRVLCGLVLLLSVSIFNVFGQDKTTVQSGAKIENTAEQKSAEPVSNGNSSAQQNNERYRIGYQDTLEVVVSRHPDLSQNVLINPDGTISLPRIEQPIVAVCKTEVELKNDITALYKKNYLRDPFVTVRVSDLKSQGFAVIGAVQKPGNFYLNRQVRLLELLSLAGGQDVEFAGGKINVARTGSVSNCKEKAETQNENGDYKFFSFRLRDVLDGKQNPLMEPGDIISVSKSEEAYVVGNVLKPTTVLLDEPKTLTQAIARAGGLDSTAKTDKVIIERQASENSPKTDLVFNLKDIRDKKIPDPQLQANDIVNVGNDKIKSIGKGLLKAITGSLPNAVYRIP